MLTTLAFTATLLLRLFTGEIISTPSDASEFPWHCQSWNGTLTQAHDAPTSWSQATGWTITVTIDYDYALWCNSNGGIDTVPAWIEDHDPSGGMLILDAASVHTEMINRDPLGLIRPLSVTARSKQPLGGRYLTVSLPIGYEYFAHDDPMKPFREWMVNVSDAFTIVDVTYERPRARR